MYDYPAEIIKVVDGDTIDVIRDAGADLFQHMRIRLNRINTPEMGTPEGKAAKAYLAQLLSDEQGNFRYIYLVTVKDKKEKYGRYLGDVWLWGEDPSDTPSVNDRMVEAGHAKYQTYK